MCCIGLPYYQSDCFRAVGECSSLATTASTHMYSVWWYMYTQHAHTMHTQHMQSHDTHHVTAHEHRTHLQLTHTHHTCTHTHSTHTLSNLCHFVQLQKATCRRRYHANQIWLPVHGARPGGAKGVRSLTPRQQGAWPTAREDEPTDGACIQRDRVMNNINCVCLNS